MSSPLFHVGDTGKALTFVCGRWDPVRRRVIPADLTGILELKVHLRRPNQTVLSVDGAVVDAPNGAGEYQWQTGNLSIHGTWTYEVQVKYADATVETFGPDSFPVARQIA